MRSLKLRKVFTSVAASVLIVMLMTAQAFAATTYLVQDGAFKNAGFINAGEAIDSAIQGPGNWTQLNLGDANADAPYLHVIVKATGDTAAAQIAVSDLFTFSLKDLGVTLTEEYQDVVLPIGEKGITMLSWLNLMGLDGGSSVYTVKDVFLSDDATSTLAAATPAQTTDAADETAVPKTGSSAAPAIIAAICMLVCGTGFMFSRKFKRA